MQKINEKYNIFIIHVWDYNSDYNNLVNMLNSIPDFIWQNNSIPKTNDEISVNNEVTVEAVKNLISDRIRRSDHVLVILGKYIDRQWVRIELDVAKAYDKPIIGIMIGDRKGIPDDIHNRLSCVVEWNKASIMDAIKGMN